MRRFILTGTPGCGKTSLLRALEVAGFAVVEEAATDVIALEQARGKPEPWKEPAFVDAILAQQLRRLALASSLPGAVQFHDRGPVCTHTLCVHLGYPPPKLLTDTIARQIAERVYEKDVFFIENLGSCEATAARRITFEESLAFERLHEESYRSFGYDLIRVAPGDVSTCMQDILRRI